MLRLNQNNLEEYLKKTEAEEIYMKKINSINMSFTSLLTSIQSVFSTYDYQLSTIHNAINVINSNTSSINSNTSTMDLKLNSIVSSISSNYNGIQSLSSNLSNLNSSFTSFKSSVNSEISNLWDAISTAGAEYNYWKEFNKQSQETYVNYEDNRTVLDNEGIEYKTYLSRSTLVSSKMSYVFNSNVLYSSNQTGNVTFSLPAEFDRLGLVCPTSLNNFIRATCSNLDLKIMEDSSVNKSLSVKCLNANIIGSKNISIFDTNINATQLNLKHYRLQTTPITLNLCDSIKLFKFDDTYLSAYLRRENTSDVLTMSALKSDYVYVTLNNGLNDTRLINKLHIMGEWMNGVFVDINNYANCSFNYTNSRGVFHINNYSSATANTGLYCKDLVITNQNSASVSFGNGFGVSTPLIDFRFTNKNSAYGFNLQKASLSTLGLDNMASVSLLSDTIKKLTISSNTHSTITQNSFYFRNLSVNTGGFYLNNTNSLILDGNNTIENLQIKDYGVGISFGSGFYNSKMSISAYNAQTYYGYNNIATLSVSPNKCKFLNCRASELRAQGGGTMENCTFTNMYIQSYNYSSGYGPWRYVSCDSLWLQNPGLFYANKLQYDQAFYHCPFINPDNEYINKALNGVNINCSKSLYFVGNAPTTSINLQLTGTNTNKIIHARFIEDQPSILSVNFKGIQPPNVLDLDFAYVFNNVASDFSNGTVKFTVQVDTPSQWSNYKNFFAPFGTPDENRITFIN